MKVRILFLALACTAVAQVPPASKPVDPAAEPSAPASSKLGEVPKSKPLDLGGVGRPNPSDVRAYPDRYKALLGQAMSSFHVRDFRTAKATMDKADELLPPTPWSLNVRGAIAIEQHQWEEGVKFCTEALRIDPAFYPAKFNLCEIPFYQKEYATARKLWEQLLVQQPKDELLLYRIFLTHLLEGNSVEAGEWMKKIPFPSETPAYHYANLALHMHRREKAKAAKDDEAQKFAEDKVTEWTRSAEFVWPLEKRTNFVDVLIHLGWVKSDDLTTQ